MKQFFPCMCCYLLVGSLLPWFSGCGNATNQPNSYAIEKSNTREPAQRKKKAVGAEDLKLHIANLQNAIKQNDTAKASAITKSLFPSEADLKIAITDKDAIQKILKMHSRFLKGDDQDLARLLAVDPDQTEISIHGATGKQLANARQSKGSPRKKEAKSQSAVRQFPGGAIHFAKAVLQPELTYYEVELKAKGKKYGMVFHLFYHNGTEWKMLGPIWRALK